MTAGRPKKIDEMIVKKLEEAFSLSCTDEEACFYAGISKQCLYDYCKENPEFTDRKEGLKKRPVYLAKRNIINSLDEVTNPDEKSRVETSKWYLERKAKDEFSTRQESTGKDGGDIVQKIFVTKEDAQEVESHIDNVIGSNR